MIKTVMESGYSSINYTEQAIEWREEAKPDSKLTEITRDGLIN